MSLTVDQIFDQLAQHRLRIASLGARRLALFGSRVRGEGSTGSDLDFLVEFEHKSFDNYMDLEALLEEVFSRPIDLVLSDALKPALRDKILEEAVDVPGI